MVRKKRRRGFLGRLAEESILSHKQEVIQVKAVVHEPESELSLISNPKAFHVETVGDGYEDKRLFVTHEDGQGGWIMEAHWQARGQGEIPYSFELLGSLCPVFNSLFNMMVQTSGHEIVNQTIGRGLPIGSPRPVLPKIGFKKRGG